MMDFESFKNKYRSEDISYFRQDKLRLENDVDRQIFPFIEQVVERCKGKVFDNDYPLTIDNPYFYIHTWSFAKTGSESYNYNSAIDYKKETMFRAVEEMNKNGWNIKIKKRYNLAAVIERLEYGFKNKTVGRNTYKLVIYNN